MTMLTPAQLDRARRAASDGRRFRLVHRARLTLGDRDDAHAMRFALEDALNTADFGDAGRLVVVRLLQVSGLRTRASSHALARSLEAAWRRAAAHAVSAGDPRASEANAVWFPSPFAARSEWLKRIAHGVLVGDWYWRSAVPEATTTPSPSVIATVLFTARADAPQALARELQSWPAPTVSRLIARLPEVGRPAPSFRGKSTAASLTADTPEANTSVSGASASAQATQSESRIAWLRALGVAGDGAASNPGGVSPALPHRAPQGADDVDVHMLRAPHADAGSVAAKDEVRSAPVLRIADPMHGHMRRSAGIQPTRTGARKSDGAQPVDAPPAHLRIAGDGRTLAWPWWADLQPTAHGGWLMLIPVLNALGFELWLDDQPRDTRASFVSRLFARLADIARVPADDPQRAIFADADPPAAHNFAWSSERWPAFLGWRAPILPMNERRALRLWAAMVLRALRRATGLTPARLARRDAEVAITRTHVDVVFPLDAIDLQLRRHGLDADPGWVPWLGRIVAFHYIDPTEAAHA